MSGRNNGLSDQWAVGIMGCRNNGSSELWAVGIMTRNRLKGRVVCGTVYGEMHLKDLQGIIRKSRILYPVLGFLPSATWPLLRK